MKLLRCTVCHDIVALTGEWRSCICKCSSGRYLKDGLHAEYKGSALLLGMLNKDLMLMRPGEYYKWFVIPEESDRIRKVD